MSVKKEIQALIDANKGKITAQKALRWTERHPDSSLYRAMDRLGLWNEGEAAEYGRLAAMQGIIRSVKVRMMDANNEPVRVRAFVSLPTDRDPDGGYRSIEAVLSDSSRADVLIAAALAELDAIRRRYETLSALRPVFEAVHQVKASRAKALRTKAKRAKVAA